MAAIGAEAIAYAAEKAGRYRRVICDAVDTYPPIFAVAGRAYLLALPWLHVLSLRLERASAPFSTSPATEINA